MGFGQGRLKIDERGSYDLPRFVHHTLYTGNDAAASHETFLEFVICDDLIVVFDTQDEGYPGRPVARLTAERGGSGAINYLRVGIMDGKEVLGACFRGSRACVWSVAAVESAVAELAPTTEPFPPLIALKPAMTVRTLDSTWGIAFHPKMPLVACSDNSHAVTLRFGIGHAAQMRICNLGGNIPSLEFLHANPLFVDTAPHDRQIYLGFVTLHPFHGSGSAGVWQLDPARLNEPDYSGKLLYSQQLSQEGWVVAQIPARCAVPLDVPPWEAGEVDNKIDASGYAQHYALVDVPAWNGTKDTILDSLALPPWLAAQSTAMSRKIARSKGRMPHARRKLAGTLLFVSTSTHAMLCRAGDFHCHAVARFSAGPSTQGVRMGHALTIAEVIEPLSLVVSIARGGKVLFFRVVESQGLVGLRHEHTFETKYFGGEITGVTARPEIWGQPRGPWIIRLWDCLEQRVFVLKVQG